MKVSFNWLKEYISIEKEPKVLGDDLSLFGLECQEIIESGDDYIFDLEITPNRGDCLSILGVAREIAAMYSKMFKKPYYGLDFPEEKINKELQIKITVPDLCPRYSVRIIDNVKVTESPDWMKKRLESYGFRSINNIVDVTNYCMIVTGQPLHAFDYDKIKDGEMLIEQAKDDDEVITLDDKMRNKIKDAIIIRDKEDIYDLAGIMGGQKSEVTDKTKTIVLEGSIFDPISIRKTSKKLNLTTDASYRYERGVDPGENISTINYAISLLKNTCPELKPGKLYDFIKENSKENRIILSLGKVNKLLGIDLNQKQAEQALRQMNFQIIGVSKAENQITVVAPSYRQYDVKSWQDLAEEIAKVYGYNEIPKRSPELQKDHSLGEYSKIQNIKEKLRELGFTEVYSYSFASGEMLKRQNIDKMQCVEIANQLSEDAHYLRPNLIASVLSQIAKNPWSPDVTVFELGKVFPNKESEKWSLVLATVGKSENILEEAKKELSLKNPINDAPKEILDLLKIRRPVKYIEEDIKSIKNIQVGHTTFKEIKFREISKYPPSVRDLAFVVSEDVSSKEIIEEIYKISENIFLVELFDQFKLKSDSVGQNKVNLAFHIWLQDIEKPLDEQNVSQIMQSIIKKIEDKFQAKLRGKEQ